MRKEPCPSYQRTAYRRLRLVLLVLLLPLLWSCTDTGAGDENGVEPIRVGVVGPYTGNLSQFGIPTRRAAELLAAEYNSAGGLLGRQIEIVAVDDQCSTSAASGAAGDLLDANVLAIVGHVCSGATREALPLYQARGFPVISPSATDPNLTDGTYPYFFRTIQPDTAITQAMIDLLLAEGRTNLYIIWDSRSDYWSDADIDRVVTQIEASATHTGTVSVDFTTDLSSAAGTVESSSATGVLILPDVSDDAAQTAADVVDALRTAGFADPAVATDNAYAQQFIDDLAATGDVYVVGPSDEYAEQRALDLSQRHSDEYGEAAGPFFVQGGAAFEVIATAIVRAGTTDAAALVQEINTGSFETALGTISFNGGDPEGGQAGYHVYQISGNAFQEYTP